MSTEVKLWDYLTSWATVSLQANPFTMKVVAPLPVCHKSDVSCDVSIRLNNERAASICCSENAVELCYKGTKCEVVLVNAHVTSTGTARLVLNPLNAELNPICYLLALLGAHHFLHVSRIRVKSLIHRLLMSYIYIYMERLFLMFLDHTQRRSTVGRTPLDE